ncbi:hypothetical protein HG531_003632 [Fusarium graminearum]|nr:hypothetical protein HG531_003632 [Fusarium graminearum]
MSQFSSSKLLLGLHAIAVDSHHGLAKPRASLCKNLGVPEVCRGSHDGLGPLGRVARLEDSAADKDTVAAELHHERRIGGRGNSAGRKVDHGETAQLGGLAEQFGVDFKLAGHLADAHDAALGESGLGLRNVSVDGLHVSHSLDNVSGAGLALCSDHGSAFSDSAEGFTQVSASADKGDAEGALFDVALVVGGGENLGLVDVVDAKGLEDLTLYKVTDTGLGHDGDGNGILDLLDHGGVGHAGDTTVLADVGGDTLEGHDGAGTGFFGNASLLSVYDVHDDTALEHLSETGLDGEGGLGLAIGGASVYRLLRRLPPVRGAV